MKAVVSCLLIIALVTVGCGRSNSGRNTDQSKCYAGAYHYAGECKKGDYVIAYNTRAASSMVPDAKSDCIVTIKGSFALDSDNKQYVCLDGLRKDGADVRTLTQDLGGFMKIYRDIRNVTTDETGAHGCVEGFKNEVIEGKFLIQYVPKDQFNIKDYQIRFNTLTLNVEDDWVCTEK